MTKSKAFPLILFWSRSKGLPKQSITQFDLKKSKVNSRDYYEGNFVAQKQHSSTKKFSFLNIENSKTVLYVKKKMQKISNNSTQETTFLLCFIQLSKQLTICFLKHFSLFFGI